MGWWQADIEGNSLLEDGELTWGDEPADLMDAALDRIDDVFHREFGRKPSLAEVLSGVMFSARVRRYEESIEYGDGLVNELLRQAVARNTDRGAASDV